MEAERPKPKESVYAPPIQYTPEYLISSLPSVPLENELPPSYEQAIENKLKKKDNEENIIIPEYLKINNNKEETRKEEIKEEENKPLCTPSIYTLISNPIEPQSINIENNMYPSLKDQEELNNQIITKNTSEFPMLDKITQTSSIILEKNDTTLSSHKELFNYNPDDNHPLFVLLVQYLLSEKEYESSKYKIQELLKQQIDITSKCWDLFLQDIVIHGGNCKCGRTLEKHIQVKNAILSNENIEKLKILCMNTVKLFSSSLISSLYSRKSYQLEVINYIDHFIYSCEFLSSLTSEHLIVVIPSENYNDITKQEINNTLELLKILFHFFRIASDNDINEAPLFFNFIKDLIIKLGAMILRCGTSEDHCLLVYLILETPGTNDWATSLLQFPTYWDNTSSSAPHFLRMLNTVLPNNNFENINKEWWITNVKALLDQFPFSEFFTFICSSHSYDDLFMAFDNVTDILSPSLKYYNDYHDICIVITKAIVRCLKSINETFSNKDNIPEYIYNKFKNLQLTLIDTIARHKETYIQQFLASLPFDLMNNEMHLNILLIIYNIPKELKENILNQSKLGIINISQWENIIKDNSTIRNDFINNLSSDRLLLHTFAILGKYSHKDLADILVYEIFYATQVCEKTREYCFKDGLQIIPELCSSHPSVISSLLYIIDKNISFLTQAILKIAENIPWYLFNPSIKELNILEKWMLSSSPGESITYFLSAIIIERLPWGYNLSSFISWLDSGSSSILSLESMHRITFLLCKVYINECSKQSGSFLRSLGIGENHFTSFENFCWRVIQKMSFNDSLGSPLLPIFTNSSNEILFIKEYISQNTNKQYNLFPIYILLQTSEIGRDIIIFKQNVNQYFDLFLAKKHNHKILVRLLHDLIPNLLSQGSLLNYTSNIENNDDSIDNNNDNITFNTQFFNKLVKSDTIGYENISYLTSKLIFQMKNQSYSKEHIHFWLDLFPSNSYIKINQYKYIFNHIALAATHTGSFEVIQDYLLDKVKGKTSILSFFTSFSFTDKQKYPWLGFHFIFLECIKQRKAWNDILSSFSEVSSQGNKQITKLLKQLGKTYNLQQLVINQIAHYCCEWEFNKCNHNLENDEFTIIILYWQIFLYLLSQTISQNIYPCSNTLGNIFLNSINSPYNSDYQIKAINTNISQISEWLEQNTTNHILYDSILRLKDLFLIINSFYNDSLIGNKSLLQQTLEIPGLFNNSKGETLFIQQIVHSSNIYKSIILKLSSIISLPLYQEQTENQLMIKQKQDNKSNVFDYDDRPTLPPPNFTIQEPRIYALSIYDNIIPIRFDIISTQTSFYFDKIKQWEQLDINHFNLLQILYTQQSIEQIESFKCQRNNCGLSERSINISNIEKNLSTEERIYYGREQLSILCTQDIEQIIPNEYCMATIQIKLTIQKILQVIHQEHNNNNNNNTSNSISLLQVRNNAEQLFIQCLELIDEKSSNFIPTKDILLKSIKDLEFILYESNSLLHIYSILLQNPRRSMLCKELFYPMLNLDYFVPFYELVINRTSVNDPETNDYLRSCLDENQWLQSLSLTSFSTSNDPSYQECIKIIKLILSSPDKQEKSFINVVSFLFPLFYYNSLEEILHQFNSRTILPETMNQFICLIEDKIDTIPPQIAIQSSKLLFKYLWNDRDNQCLYNSHYSVFSSLFLRLNRILFDCVIKSGTQDLKESLIMIHTLYQPWIGNLPLQYPNKTDKNKDAWLETHEHLAIPFLSSYSESILQLIQIYSQQISFILQEFWKFFILYLSSTSSNFKWIKYNELFTNPLYNWKYFNTYESFINQLIHQIIHFKFILPQGLLDFYSYILNNINIESEWKLFYRPILALYHCKNYPIDIKDLHKIQQNLLHIQWEIISFNEYKDYLTGDIINNIFNYKYLGNQIQGPQIVLPKKMDILSDKPISNIEEHLFFCLNYLRQPCASENYLNRGQQLDLFIRYQNLFTDYLEFIVYWMFRITEFKTVACGNVLSQFLFHLAYEFSLNSPFIHKYLPEQEYLKCIRIFLSIYKIPVWIDLIQPLVNVIIHNNIIICPFVLGSCTLDLTSSKHLPNLCEIILSTYFKQESSKWINIMEHFIIPKSFPHLPFQNTCAKTGYILALYCYFKRLFDIHKELPNELLQIITDYWSIIQTIPMTELKLPLLYFQLIDAILIHLLFTKRVERGISSILNSSIIKLKILASDPSGKILGLGGGNKIVAPLETRIIYKFLYSFLCIQVNQQSGMILGKINHIKEYLNPLTNLLKKRDYKDYYYVIKPTIDFLSKCNGRGLFDIKILQKILYIEIYKKKSQFYWIIE